MPEVATPAREEQAEFVASVAHDLLEPLSTVTGYLDLFLRRHGDGLSDEARELVDSAVVGARGMQALVTGLLELTGSAPPEGDRHPVDLGAVVTQVVARLSNTLDAVNGTIVVDGTLPTVLGDDVQLARLFQNLVANALKFGRPHVAPVVRISASATLATGVWELAVIDNGIGIEAGQREQVFGTFKRLHPRSRYPGSGLGLAICRRIVQDHGGRIWIDDGPGGGSAFRFTLPAGGAA